MSDQLEQRLDRLAPQSGTAGAAPPAALLAALRQRRTQRSLQRVFVVGSATLVGAAACITLVVVFGGPAGAPTQPRQVVDRDRPVPPAQPGGVSIYTVAHGWTAVEESNVAQAPPPRPASAPAPPERIFSAGSLYSRDVAEGLLS